MQALAAITGVQRNTVEQLAIGAALALVGVALVEALQLAGLRPLSPLGWPGLGMLTAVALAGGTGLAGGSLVLAAYYAFNFAHQYRFPEFYASPLATVSWIIGLSAFAATVLIVRPRLLRAAANEMELEQRRAYEQALRESEGRLKLITDNVPALVAYIDAQERYRFNNRAFEEWLGMPREAMSGRAVREVWGERRYALLKPNIERALRGERVTHDFALAGAGAGQERHVLASYVPDVDAAGRVKGFFLLGSDITQLAAARGDLRMERERLEAALDGSSVALWDTDLRTRRVYLSDAWAEIVGTPPGDTVTTLEELEALMHPEERDMARRLSLEVMKGLRAVYAVEHRVRARSGEWKWIISRGRVTERDPASGHALRMIGTNVDITDRRRMEEAVQVAAQSDPLTGLANRAAFAERLKLAAARSRRTGSRLAVLYLDLDRFKQVNDSLGHEAGDLLLKDFAARLRAVTRASDTVARFGGDEFVVLLEDVAERQNALRVAEKIMLEGRRLVLIEGRGCVATASIGIAFAEAGTGDEGLLKRADQALYDAKGAGRDCYRIAEM
ncbi:MAG TPA: diguanylate cyclase [Burkholderiales bacterium]|nr:diguanylate cyclase [Burkholderiales bacterium]